MNIKKINKNDINKVFIRSTFLQSSWNFERMQSLGFCFSIIPIINKLYNNNKKKKKAIKRHLEFFNTQPYMVAPILGVVIALEEQKANGININKKTINNIKIGLMGPLAGIGDPIFWGTVRPILSSLSSNLSINGSIIGPILFFISFNVIRLTTLYFGIHYGYKKGINIIKDISNNLLQKITEGSSILGLFIMGALINKWTKISIPIVISNIKNDKLKNVLTIQNILDKILPGILPLILTIICMWLLKKKINPLTIIMMIFLFSIISKYLHVISN